MEKRFTPEQQALLNQNPNVVTVSEKVITYSPAFKLLAVRQNIYGNKPPVSIFTDAGFDLDMIGHSTPRKCLERWRAVYHRLGEDGLLNDRRGKNSPGRLPSRELTLEQELQRAKAKIRLLEQENELLKKVERLERSVVDKPTKKFGLIQQILDQRRPGEKPLFTVKYLCELVGVSRSGYFKWRVSRLKRKAREQSDYEDHLLIKAIFDRKKHKAGWRTIQMNLARQHIIMNHKKIRRLMRKYGLITRVRRRNPYRFIAKATQEHVVFPNILARNFASEIPFKTLGTDITYLYYNGGRCYLSVILDMASGEILAHQISSSLGAELSVGLLIKFSGTHETQGALIHSDQGTHYTNPSYVKLVQSLGMIQSMSRKGNCLDNAPVESFFGHMKDEVDLALCASVAEVRHAIDCYIDEYNHFRYQWTKKKMAPVEYRNHLQTA